MFFCFIFHVSQTTRARKIKTVFPPLALSIFRKKIHRKKGTRPRWDESYGYDTGAGRNENKRENEVASGKSWEKKDLRASTIRLCQPFCLGTLEGQAIISIPRDSRTITTSTLRALSPRPPYQIWPGLGSLVSFLVFSPTGHFNPNSISLQDLHFFFQLQ